MAIYRTEKTENFTPLSNGILRSTTLSLNAKGLMLQILSYPDGWAFSIENLTRCCKESSETVRSALHELENQGYIRRSRVRNANGKLSGVVYVIFEMPKPEYRAPGSRAPVIPESENRTLLNTYQTSIYPPTT